MSSTIIVSNKKIIRRLVKEIPGYTKKEACVIAFDEESEVGKVFGKLYGFNNINKLKGVEREFEPRILW